METCATNVANSMIQIKLKERPLKEKELFLIQKEADLNFDSERKIRNMSEAIEQERKQLKQLEAEVEVRVRRNFYSKQREELHLELDKLSTSVAKDNTG